MASSTRLRRVASSLGGALLVLACARPGLHGQTYRDREVAFRVGPIPSTWRAIHLDDTRLAFRDDTARTTVAVNGRCGKDGDDVPLTALTAHLFLVFTDRTILSQEEFTLDGRAALRTELAAKLDGVPRRFTVIVLKKDGCVYDLILIADPRTEAGAFAAFERFAQGFATLR